MSIHIIYRNERYLKREQMACWIRRLDNLCWVKDVSVPHDNKRLLFNKTMKTNTSIFSFEGRIKEIRLQQKKAESNLEKQTHHDRREGGTNDSGIAESFNSFSLISPLSAIYTRLHIISAYIPRPFWYSLRRSTSIHHIYNIHSFKNCTKSNQFFIQICYICLSNISSTSLLL